MKRFVAVLILFLSTPLCAKIVTVTYDRDSCSCRGQIDSDKINPNEFKTAMGWGFTSDLKITFWTEFEKLTVAELKKAKERDEKNLHDKEESLKVARLPDLPSWKKVREVSLRDLELTRHLQLAELNYLIDGDTKLLAQDFQKKAIPKACNEFVEALRSPSKIKEAFNKDPGHCKDNGVPEQCLARAKEKAAGSSGAKYMQVELLMFGWHNCVNHEFRDHLDEVLKPAQNELLMDLYSI